MAFSHNEITFKGSLNKLEQKEGDGEQMYKDRQGNEYYNGNFKKDAYNGCANYFANSIKRGLWAYEGSFCANSIEGYGAMSYVDATYFAGLFKDDKPFGPGVLTYPDARQDVGIWDGSQIYRLCTTVGQIEKLTNSPQDRIQVAKFKKLIPINQSQRNIASIILKSVLGAEEHNIDPSVLYSRFCKNPRSYLYNHNYFNDNLDDLEEIEKSLIAEESEDQLPDSGTLATKFVNTSIVQLKEHEFEDEEDIYGEISDLTKNRSISIPNSEVFVLSWNNTPKVIDIMKHSFKHRIQEEAPDFDIGNILCGRRTLYRMRGPKENGSIKILEASARNDVMTILKQLNRHTLNIDVMDNKGNSMILRAAANDALDVMQLLHFLGADIDAVNDEGFSALTHTMTRFVALTYDVTNWSNGFLPRKNKYEEMEDTEDHWLDDCMQSDLSINPGSIVSVEQPTPKTKTKKTKKYTTGTPLTSKYSISSPSTTRESPKEYVFDFSPEPRFQQRRSINEGEEARKEKQRKLEIIQNTAFYLLDMGVDIHVSETPAPVMVLAIFSGNLRIVEKLLKSGADANEVHNINNGQITALHIIAQARPLPSYPAMVNMFLRYGADPDLRTSTNYNILEWQYLLEHMRIQPIVPGLTPLHIIAMRSDAPYVTNKEYLEQICCLLSWFSNHNERFLGLSPLGLAISKGNNNIVSTMLNCAKIDVNETFDSFWGNPLFTYLRCHGSRDDSAALNILQTLILKGANPLETNITAHGKGNAMNFMVQLREKKKSLTRGSLFGYLLPVHNEHSMKTNEQILMELAKVYLRKYIRGVLVRLHLKFISSMDAERDNFRRQLHLYAKHQAKNGLVSEMGCDGDKNVYGYAELCERTKDWMNSLDECKFVMEKTIESLGDPDSPMQAIRLISLLPNITIRTKRPELKNLKLTKLLEGKCLPDLMNCPLENKRFSLESPEYDDEDKGDEEKNLKWIRHFVTLHNNNVHVYPELEKNRSKYTVCYKCLKQSSVLQACPMCRLVYFCSMRCNLADSNKPDPYHRCAVVFWNLKAGQFFSIGKAKESHTRITKSSESKTKFSPISRKPSFETPAKASVTNEEEQSIEEEELWTGRARRKRRIASSVQDFKKKYLKHGKRPKDTKHPKDKKRKKRYDFGKTQSKRGKGKVKKSKLGSRFLHYRPRYGTLSISGEGSEVDIFGLIEKDRKIEAIGAKANVDMAARLLEKQSHVLQQIKLETERLKEAQDNIDTRLLGEKAPPEEFWEQHDEKGKEKIPHSSQDRFMAFLKVLESRFHGFDYEKYLPFIVFVDGVIYYKRYDFKTKYKENYSFN